VDTAIARVEKSVAVGQSLLVLYQIEVDRDTDAAQRTHEKLIQQIPKASTGQARTPDYLLTLRESLSASKAQIPKLSGASLPDELQNELSQVDRMYLPRVKGLDGAQHRQYQVHGQIYELVAQQLARSSTAAPPPRPPAGAIDRESADAVARIMSLPAIGGAGTARGARLEQVCTFAKQVIEWSARRAPGVASASPQPVDR
jgi:hypothetical protein